MTTALTVIAVVAVLTLPALALDWWDRRRARKRHPANWTPATEEHIEQAVAIVDDGKALVRETEDYLRRRVR